MEANITQFCVVTGASQSNGRRLIRANHPIVATSSVKDARRFLEKYKRVDIAMDAYYNDPNASAATGRRQADGGGASTSKLNALFDKYKDPDAAEITVDGTIKLCEDLGVNPEDVVLLAVAFELKSPRVGEWNKKGWTDGWKNIGCDSISGMRIALKRLRDKLGSDPDYFQQVYNHTFDFARGDGQRSLGVETAQAFWALLLPHGLHGGALSHVHSTDDDDDDDMGEEEGWRDEYTSWWFEFLNEKGGKGVSKDTWAMFLEFVRSIDSEFENYDMEEAWPSTIDDFVGWAKERLALAA